MEIRGEKSRKAQAARILARKSQERCNRNTVNTSIGLEILQLPDLHEKVSVVSDASAWKTTGMFFFPVEIDGFPLVMTNIAMENGYL